MKTALLCVPCFLVIYFFFRAGPAVRFFFWMPGVVWLGILSDTKSLLVYYKIRLAFMKVLVMLCPYRLAVPSNVFAISVTFAVCILSPRALCHHLALVHNSPSQSPARCRYFIRNQTLGSQLRESQGTPAPMPCGFRPEPQHVNPPASISWHRIPSSIIEGSFSKTLMRFSRKLLNGMTS